MTIARRCRLHNYSCFWWLGSRVVENTDLLCLFMAQWGSFQSHYMFHLSVFCHCGKLPVKTTYEEKKFILSHSFGGFSPSLVNLLLCVACDDSTHHDRSVRQRKFITSWLHVKWRGREEAGKVTFLLGTYLQRPNIPPAAISLRVQIPISSRGWGPSSWYTSL